MAYPAPMGKFITFLMEHHREVCVVSDLTLYITRHSIVSLYVERNKGLGAPKKSFKKSTNVVNQSEIYLKYDS
jgi:hypothetical protein